MKTSALITILFALLVNKAEGQNTATASDTAILKIKQLTNQWYAAIKNRDSVTIEGILADDYTVNGSWPKSK
jgi:hypothetical protein